MNGSRRVVPVSGDLQRHWENILLSLPEGRVDLLINAASATSRLRDNQLQMEKLDEYVSVDLLAPLHLAEKIWAGQAGQPLAIIFISSILAVLRTPNRTLYGNLKMLQEESLKSLAASRPGMSLLIVRVAKVLPVDRRTKETAKLAQAVRRAFAEKRKTLTYGTAGRLSVALFYAQPLVFSLVVKARRLIFRN